MKKKTKIRLLLTGCSTLAILMILYCLFVFSSIPFFAYWRGIWIETAMTTADHQWLATFFLPSSTIEKVMKPYYETNAVIGGSEYLETTERETTERESTQSESTEIETVPITTKDETTSLPDDTILQQKSIQVGDSDYAGYTVLINDKEQGLVISEIIGHGFKGKVMLIDDPSRVFVGTTSYKNSEGMRILKMMDSYDTVAGINASGFSDPNGEGSGGDVMGLTCSNGTYWGNYANFYGSVVLTASNKLVVGNFQAWNQYAIRDGIQFGPVLIADGIAQVQGSAGWGVQPRTAIGQRRDGVIVMIVIDGRNVTHSIGCTVGDLAEILMKYDVINASCCDGGSSSVMAYNGKVITKNSSLNPTVGRMLPNAFLVKKK